MYVARPDAPAEVHKAMERRLKNASGGSSDKTGVGVISMICLYSIIFRDQFMAHPLLKDALIGTLVGLLAALLNRTIVTPARNIRKFSGYLKQGYVIEVPDQLWARYAEICSDKGIKPQLSDFSGNIPVLTAQIMPAYSRSVEATEKAKAHLEKFVDTKLGEIASGSASLAKRNELEELDALQTEFPVDEGPEDPKSLR